MPDDKRMIAIAIAVAASVPRRYLPGAVNGARAFKDWASRQGYETVLVTDEQNPVTMGLVRKEIEDLLKASSTPIHRIIVYFAGHGLIREIEEGLWLLSDWGNDLRAVAVEVLKRRLSMYGARQLCIISDACRSLPSDIQQADLVPDSVLGAGPGPVDATMAIDKFIAAQDATQAFTIPGEDPGDDRCLFSGVLIEGLWGLAGLQEQPFSKREPDKVTSRSSRRLSADRSVGPGQGVRSDAHPDGQSHLSGRRRLLLQQGLPCEAADVSTLAAEGQNPPHGRRRLAAR